MIKCERSNGNGIHGHTWSSVEIWTSLVLQSLYQRKLVPLVSGEVRYPSRNTLLRLEFILVSLLIKKYPYLELYYRLLLNIFSFVKTHVSPYIIVSKYKYSSLASAYKLPQTHITRISVIKIWYHQNIFYQTKLLQHTFWVIQVVAGEKPCYIMSWSH